MCVCAAACRRVNVCESVSYVHILVRLNGVDEEEGFLGKSSDLERSRREGELHSLQWGVGRHVSQPRCFSAIAIVRECVCVVYV